MHGINARINRYCGHAKLRTRPNLAHLLCTLGRSVARGGERDRYNDGGMPGGEACRSAGLTSDPLTNIERE